MASISLASQYFGNEGVAFVLQPTVAGMTGETYQWSVGGTPIAGQTSRALTISAPALTDSGNYTVEAVSAGTSYSTSTRVDIIQALPTNYQRAAGEVGSLSIQEIPGATYQWVRSALVEGTPENLTGKSSRINSYSSVASTDYGVIQIRVSKNGVSALSNECYFTDYTPITFNNGITQTFTFPNSQRIYTFLEASPDGRLIFIDDTTPRTLWVTVPGFADQTSFERNIQLYELPKPSVNASPTASSPLPQLTRYNGIFGNTSSSNVNYYFTDDVRSFTDDGKYLAVVCTGNIASRSGTSLSTNSNQQFIIIYKLEGTTITIVQTLIYSFYKVGNSTFTQGSTSTSLTTAPKVSFSGNGIYLGVSWGFGDVNLYSYRVYKKNNNDTWGTIYNPATGDAERNISPTFTIIPRSGSTVYGGRFNSDGTFLSLCVIAAGLTQLTNYFIYSIDTTTNVATRNTTLETKLLTELQKITNTTVYHKDDSISLPILFYFPRGITTKLIGYNNVSSTSEVLYKNNIYIFSYDASTQTPSILYHYNLYFFPDNNGNGTTNISRNFFQISDDGTYLLNTWNQNTAVANNSTKRIFKIPSYYHNKINPTTGVISTANERAYVQYVHLFETSNIEVNNNYNGYIYGNKFILFSPRINGTYKMALKTITLQMENVKPTITDTSAKIYMEQDECTVGTEIKIKDFLENSSFFQTIPKGILLRIKNNTDASGNQVAFWKLKSDYATSSALINFSNTYSSTNQDKWYIFYTDENTSIRLDMDMVRLFNNAFAPDRKITLEYKLWSGYGWNNPGFDNTNYTKNVAGLRTAFTINGSVVTIGDITASPFSNETGELQVFIKNVINSPDPFGRIYAPLTTTGTGSTFNNTTRTYVYSMNVLRNSLASKTFSLRDILNIFRPTMSTDYPITSATPYSADDYNGGIGLAVRHRFGLQVSINNGNTWNFLAPSANPMDSCYFFSLRVRNYLFRYARQVGSMDQLNVYIFPWNGIEISIDTTNIKEFSSPNLYTINSQNEVIISPLTRVASNQIQDADANPFPTKGRYATGDTSSQLNTSGIWANLVNNTKPQFKATSGRVYTLKTVDNDGNIINSFINDNDTSSTLYSFTPNDIFYGRINNGVRTSAITLRPGITINDTCDVYDSDISGDERLLGLVLPRDLSVYSDYGKWQYTIDAGVSWTDLYISDSSTLVIRFWSYLKNDNRIRLRFNPIRLEKSTSVEVPFFLYDGADYIPYSENNNNNFETTAYQLNGTSFLVSTDRTNTAMLTGRSDVSGNLTLDVNHINTAPAIPLNYAPTSTVYKYNSMSDISFNNQNYASRQITSYSYSSTSSTRNVNLTSTSTQTPLNIYTISNTFETTKNKFRINVADIINNSSITDIDKKDFLGIALYSADLSSASVKLVDNLGNETTIAQPTLQNAYHIPNYLYGSGGYNITDTNIRNNINLTIWLNMADPALANGSSLSRLFLKTGSNQLDAILNYKLITAPSTWDVKSLNHSNPSTPTVVPNIINGNPVLRFSRSSKNYIQLTTTSDQSTSRFYPMNSFLSDATNNLCNMIIVERKLSNPSGRNPLFTDGSSYFRFFFGYSADNQILLEYINDRSGLPTSGQVVSLSYTDDSLAQLNVVRMWHIKYELISTKEYISIYLNNVLVARKIMSIPFVSTFSYAYFLGAKKQQASQESSSLYYDGDLCDFVVYNSTNASSTNQITKDTALTFIKNLEDYISYKWLNPSLIIQSSINQTIDLSYNFYVWDRTNENTLTNGYGAISTRGGNTSYSANSGIFTLKIQKANSRPVLSMNASTTTNTAILPGNSTATKLAFKLGELDIATQTHDFLLTSIFDDIIKDRYTDEDMTSTPPDTKGLAITQLDTTLGTWSVVKTDGSVEVLTAISTTNAYLIKRDTPGNKLRLTLTSSTNTATNRYHTNTTAGLPGTAFFQAIAWDATNTSYSEYSKVNLSTAADPTDVENSFSIVANGVFEFRVSTRPYIAGSTIQRLFVFNSDPTLTTLTPNTFLSQFKTSQTTSGTKRIDVYNIDNLDSAITLQYQVGSSWTDITLPLTAPINGTYPIRIKESTALSAVNKTFSLLMALYDSGTGIYSPNFGSINIQVQEANLPPSIQTNLTAISKPRIANITSSTITYETVFNDIGNGVDDELPPSFSFLTYTSFNSNINIKPIIWTDQNISSNLKLNAFSIQIMETLNGRFYYADENGDFKDVVVTNTTDRFLLSSINTLKYIPTTGNSGKALIRIYAWDGVQGTIGTRAEADANGAYTQGAFSTNYITVEFPIIPRNNAPSFVLNNKLYPASVEQTDTNADISGVSIKSIIANTIGFDYVELNGVNDKGLVIMDTSGADLGTWQASTNGGGTWTTAATGLHLLADNAEVNRLRFSFNMNRATFPSTYSEIPTVRVAAWDKTNSVANGAVAAIDASGGPAAYSAETVRLGAAISHRNHAPTLATGTTRFNIGSVNANATVDISFQTILAAIGNGVMSDPDNDDTVGIKIQDISFNNTPQAGVSMGTWSYTDSILNGIYTPVIATSTELMPSKNPVLRFQADKYVFGTATLAFRAYDGQLTSSGIRTLSLTVNDINYAPTYANTADISYNVVFDVSRTILVSSIVNALRPSDRNSGTTYGIVVSATSFDNNVGILQYTTNAGATIPVYNTITNSLVGSNSTAIHIPSNGALRYTPKLNQFIQISFDILLWDRSNNASVVAAAGNAITVPSTRDEFSPYSASSVKLIFNHTSVNFAPTINTGSTTLETVDSLATSSTYSIPILLTQMNWADANTGDKRGLVIVGTDMCGGTYEYTLNGGSSWTTIPSTLSLTNGLHFDDQTTAAIRYVSNRNTTDFSTLTLIGWDQTTTVSHGTTASIPSTRGGNTSYSANTHTLRIEQTHVNSRPTLTNGTSRTTPSVNYHPTDYTWYQFSTYVPISTTFSDADYSLVRRGGTPQVADKTFGILITAADISAGNWLISSDKRIITDITTVNESAAVIVSPSDYFALRTSKNNTTSFALTYKAWDKSSSTTTTTVDTTDSTNTSYSVNSGTIVVPVVHVNTPPSINASATGYEAPTIAGDGDDNPDPSGVPITSIIDDLITRGVYTDPDNTLWGYTNEPKGLVILGATLATTTGTWAYSTNGGTSWASIPTTGTNRLHLTYSASNRIRYRPSNNTNGTAVLRVAAWDQANGVANGSTQAVSSTQRTDAIGQSYSVNETTLAFPTSYLNHAPIFGTSSYTMPTVEFGNVNNGKDWASILTALSYSDKDTQDPRGVVVGTITIPADVNGVFQVLAGTTWSTLTTGLQFTLPFYTSIRFIPSANITVDTVNVSVALRPYDGLVAGTTSATIVVPIKKALFSPTITASLPTNLIQRFRADNKLSAFGGVTQGVSMTKLLDDMGFTDQSAGDGRGIAIQSLITKGITGYFEVKLGTAPWTRIPTISTNSFYLLGEFTGTVANRIRFFSTNSRNTGFVGIVFYGWDQSDKNTSTGIISGALKQYTTRPISFSARNGTYRIEIQRIVGR